MYCGEVYVEDNDFVLEFVRLIPREKEIAFEIIGEDDDGDFRTEGIAIQISTGIYKADATVEYPTYFVNNPHSGSETWKGLAIIIINKLMITPHGRRCHIKGEWRQDGEIWEFHGSLRKIRNNYN